MLFRSILRFIAKFFFGIVKKIIILIIIIIVAIWYIFFRGKDTNLDFNKIKDTVYNDYLKGVTVDVVPNSKEKQDINDDIKKQIDLWVTANNLNQYGDPKGTVYIGGTPLFNEKTGETIDRYDYIVGNNPQLKELFK